MINIKKLFKEIEISLLTKSGPHYSSSLNCRDWEKKNNDNIC